MGEPQSPHLSIETLSTVYYVWSTRRRSDGCSLQAQTLHALLLHGDSTDFLYYDGVVADNVRKAEAKDSRRGIESIPFRARELRANEYAVHHIYHEFESILRICIWNAAELRPTEFPKDRRSWLWDLSIFLTPGIVERFLEDLPDKYDSTKCKELYGAFRHALSEDHRRESEYSRSRFAVPKDQRDAWTKENPEDLNYNYTTFPDIMKAFSEKAEACKNICCIKPASG